MLNTPGLKGNANKNHIKIPPHYCQNSYHQEPKKQILSRMQGKKEPSYNAVKM
jgi:hypothetical protein